MLDLFPGNLTSTAFVCMSEAQAHCLCSGKAARRGRSFITNHRLDRASVTNLRDSWVRGQSKKRAGAKDLTKLNGTERRSLRCLAAPSMISAVYLRQSEKTSRQAFRVMGVTV